jgi:hypothetical protein
LALKTNCPMTVQDTFFGQRVPSHHQACTQRVSQAYLAVSRQDTFAVLL